jgi:8-oxo-dGTP pyrophosphatase MutT (NUDIX family)
MENNMKRKKIARAGFIPYYVENETIYVLMMKPSNAKYGGTQFQIAKGKIEAGEDAETAALREAKEEIGLLASNVVSVHYLGRYLGRTSIFYGEIKDKNNFIDTTYETDVTKWMSIEEFLKDGRDIHKFILRELREELTL